MPSLFGLQEYDKPTTKALNKLAEQGCSIDFTEMIVTLAPGAKINRGILKTLRGSGFYIQARRLL